VPGGIDFTAFLKSRTVLFNHDHDQPVARAVSVERTNNGLRALAQFPAPGIDSLSDRVYGLIKSGVINAASIGFIPLEVERRESRLGTAGFTIKEAELLEFSFVSVPSNRESLINERSRAYAR
jgi:HK97 family phage prohead protease